MKQIVIIADDLTGACDTGIKFRRLGIETKVLVNPNSAHILNTDPSAVVSINTDTRSVSSENAKTVVAQLVAQLKAQGDYFYYKKVDSVLRGNISSELEAMFHHLQPDFALIAPAFPATGRWLKDGVLRIGNKETPELELNALKLITSSTSRKCGHINLDIVRAGTEAVMEKAEELYRDGCTLILADTWCEVDLQVLAAAVLRFGSRCLSVGSAGLANHLAQRLADHVPHVLETDTPVPKDGALVVVVGSRHPVTVEQVQVLKEAVALDTYLLDVSGINQDNLTERVEDVFRSKSPGCRDNVLLTTKFIYNNSDDCRHLLQQNAYNQSILDGISLSVQKLAQQLPIRGMIATGGDIASEILRKLQFNQITLMTEPMPGIVTGQVVDNAGNNFLLATKSGGFGDPNALLELYRYIAHS